MIKDIKYGSYTAQPSDYICQDGELSASENLIVENGSVVPVAPPVPVLQLDAGDRVLLVHKTAVGGYYIIASRLDDERDRLDFLPVDDEDMSHRKTIGTISRVITAAAIGNSVVLTTKAGLSYLFFKDYAYTLLGARPPFVSIDFGLEWGVESLAGSFEYPHGDNIPIQSEIARLCTNHVFGLIGELSSSVNQQGKFWQPFFIRYAIRLFDGSYILHSAPILMLPTVLPPQVRRVQGSNGDWNIYSRAFLPSCKLNYRIVSDSLAGMDEWMDIVAGIDVFVSAPIYTYNQAGIIYGAGIEQNEYFKRLRLSDNDAVLVGHFAGPQDSEVYRDHHVDEIASLFPGWADNYLNECWQIYRPDAFLENVKNPQLFYKLAELDIDDILEDDNIGKSFRPLPIKANELDLRNLVTRPALTDDFQTHCSFAPKVLHSYNSRLQMANVCFTPPAPYPLRSAVAFSNYRAQDVRTGSAVITVYSRVNGVKVFAVQDDATESNTPYNLAENFPRYLFYPDASAYKMKIQIGKDIYRLKLTSSDYLNGAYWFGGLEERVNIDDNVPEESGSFQQEVAMPTRLYTSEVNNPFVFKPENVTTIGNGAVMALAAAAQALSQGQFGQFPLYAFTEEGVWALEISATGTISARQPITRDVCITPDAVTQLDSSVLFPTSRGIMRLSGSAVSCVSDAINSEAPFDVRCLPGLPLACESCTRAGGELLPILHPAMPLSEFLLHCQMIYDYPNQRIVVFSEKAEYAYVLSLQSGCWGMIYSEFRRPINAYPDTLAMDASNRIVKFPATCESAVRGLLVTRPIKLETPDVLKTMDTVIQRGHFRKGNVQSVLYGSRDLRNWHLVWSSKDHYLRGFRGTPYKYFRIALLCNLKQEESIYGASLQFTPRQTNQPR